MPRLEFSPNPLGRAKTVDVPEGGELLDICDAALAPVPFSCRSGTCGTCQVEVFEGIELLEPPESEEAELLSLLGGNALVRLACRARVKEGPGVVRLRVVE